VGVLSTGLFRKGQSVGRLITMSAVGGVLVAAIAVPAVGTIGIVTRNAANKFEAMSTQALGEVPQPSQILDSKGHVLASIYNVTASYYYGPGNVKTLRFDGIDRVPVSYDQISPVMRNAIIAIEDSRYYQHGAIDFRGTVRALVNNLEHKPVQGGSTIAQQYVKNVLVLTAKNPVQAEGATKETISRKIHELRLAIAVEHKMSRNQILAGYLNDAYFGNLAVGVQVAAQTYFGTSAKKLSLAQAALLAGLVENPTAYNPITHRAIAIERRNTVLARMQQLHMISAATAAKAEHKHLGLHVTPQLNGCSSASAGSAAFFCDYVEQVILRDPKFGKTPMDRAKLLATGGLKIYTTLSPQDQRAASNAVNYWVPPHGGPFNPGRNADTEAVVQPGTGRIKAMAEDRPYGTGPGQTTINLAVDAPYDGGSGIQSGSSNKLFTLITALQQNVPFGFTMSVQNHASVSGITNCDGQTLAPYSLVNASKSDAGTFSLYTGTTQSINTFYANLEQKVGLCNVVKTAVALGDHRADGTSLWSHHGGEVAADNITSFTLGSVNVSPLTMAAAYATVAARGTYCRPVAITKIVTGNGKSLQVPKANCHRAIKPGVADAVSYILQGVLVNGTAAGQGLNRPSAGKTGTGDGPHYVDFAGYTPTLVSYTSVFQPQDPITHPMVGVQACYRGGCPGTMFGANAPAQTWHTTFMHANLGPPIGFVPVNPASPLFSQGNGQTVKQKGKPGPPHRPGPGGGGGGGGGGGPHHCPKHVPFCPPTP
jgi:membrane peptidoglycan carboxypeptidase